MYLYEMEKLLSGCLPGWQKLVVPRAGTSGGLGTIDLSCQAYTKHY
jgi:hypothetical protein